MKKARIYIAFLLLVCSITACSQNTPNKANNVSSTGSISAVELITKYTTAKSFTNEAVAKEDIEKILFAGIQAPSARNSQPWHFSVLTNKKIMEKIMTDMSTGMGNPLANTSAPAGNTPPANASRQAKNSGPTVKKAGIGDSPLAIIISGTSDFDCGLACENMSIAAVSLGYATKIVTSPTIALNGKNQAEYKELLDIPESMKVVAVLLIGKSDTDAVSNASTRNPISEVVSYIE